MELNEREIEIIHETHDEIIKISTVLLGANGDDGLVGDVKRHGQAILLLNEKHNSLNNKLWWLIGILAGSGILGVGAWQILT